MASSPYELLGISPEADVVRNILAPSKPAERQVYGSPYQQAGADYEGRIRSELQDQQNVALQSEIARRMTLPTRMGAQARSIAFQQALAKAQYEKQTGQLLSDLQKLDPADPESLTQQDEIFSKHPVARQALSDPRVSNLVKRQSHEHEELQTLFDSDASLRQQYADLRANGVAPPAARQQVKNAAQRQAERIWFASNGGDPAEFDSGKYNKPDGTFDRAKAAYAISQRKAMDDSLLSSVERKALDKVAEGLQGLTVNPDDPEAKRTAFRLVNKREPESEQDWSAAYRLVQNTGKAEREALVALVEDFERAGKKVPQLYKDLLGGESVPRSTEVGKNLGALQSQPTESSKTDANVPQNNSGIPTVNSPEEVKKLKLPSGSRFMTPDGQIRTVK